MSSRSTNSNITASSSGRNRDGSQTSTKVPYPVEYSSEQLVFDNWNQMFLTSLFKGMTARQAETPPSKVLDLGCGSGLWVLEAAKCWPKSTFVGVDFRLIQPDLKLCATQPGLRDIVARVRWVHGNFLDPLPFAANSFDFVRMCGVGLGVPEDKWQKLLQEVSRVLVPGGIVEVIEDDLTFPCGSQPEWSPPEPNVAPRLLPTSPSTDTVLGDSPTLSRSSRLTRKTSSSRLVSSLFPSDEAASQNSVDLFNELVVGSVRIDYLEILDPKNHSKLKAAWDHMLHKRFLPSGLLSVLQFYFTAEFDETESFPILQVPLPPNTRRDEDEANKPSSSTSTSTITPPTNASFGVLPTLLENSISMRDLGIPYIPTLGAHSDPVLEDYHRLAEPSPSGSVTSSTWAHMHLGKIVSIIQGCKEAIWEEYKALEEPGEADILGMRDEFLAAWLNWECDMKDRMRMRKNMHQSVSWTREAPAEPPDGKAWRTRAGYMEVDEEDPILDHRVGRALRAFVGRKPFNRDH